MLRSDKAWRVIRTLKKGEGLDASGVDSKVSSRAGFTFIEVMIALAATGLFASAVSSYMVGRLDYSVNQRALRSRDKVSASIGAFSQMPVALRSSAQKAENARLLECLAPISTYNDQLPGDCKGGVLFPLTLFGPIVGSAEGIASGAMAGPPSQPIYYDQHGIVCKQVDGVIAPDCAIKVSTQFKAQCPPWGPDQPPATLCDVAEVIEVFFAIEPVGGGGSSTTVRYQISPVYGSAANDAFLIFGNRASLLPVVLSPPPPPPPPIIYVGWDGPDPIVTGVKRASGDGSESGDPSDPTAAPPPPPPPKPAVCVGDTILIAPNTCGCPPGMILKNKRTGTCMAIAI